MDGDGDVDLFLGARAQTWKYGVKPDSYIFFNDGKGNFKDVTDTVAPFLKKFGLVKQATWADMDGDHVADLIVAAEWAPITILLNKKNKLVPLSLEGSGLDKSNGWWNIVQAADFDKDGDLDLIAGNLGTNSRLKASEKEPVKMFVADFDKNDSIDQILSHFVHGVEYPFHTRDEMTKQMPYLKKRYLSYHKFSEATLHDMYPEDLLKTAIEYDVYNFQTSYIENLGNGKFQVKALPKLAQFSTVNALVIEDFNGDGNEDVLAAGNFYPINIQMGRNDASYGVLLLGDGKGHFRAMGPGQSGISLKGEIRSMRKIKVGARQQYMAVRNNNTVEFFALKNTSLSTGK
jgi:hypothetical protein